MSSRIAKNEGSTLWVHLEDRWTATVEEAKTALNRCISNRYERSAANELLSVAADSTPREIIVTVLAMFVLLHEMRWRFRSDDAFRVQLARRVRAHTSQHTRLIYNNRTGKQQRVYREMTPKAGKILGQKLSSAFGALGFQLALLDERDRDRARKGKDAVATAIRELR